MKNLLIGTISLLVVMVGITSMSAFEAYVVNVTAKIENALYVHPESRDFGTMFPQEYAEMGIFITFSKSFSATAQKRVSKVDYKIVQKPKPRPEYVAQVGLLEARKWCHDNYPQVPFDKEASEWQEYLSKCYLLLCPYLSKTPDNFPQPGNDKGVPAFHDPFSQEGIAYGTIDKNGTDAGDTWLIDLAVPCFEGQCSQDWASFVKAHNPSADPDEFTAPEGMSGEVFGCDLWIEVTKVY